MEIKVNDCIMQICVIKPIEARGRIVALNQSKRGTELQVDYFLNGEHRLEWFVDTDIDLIANASKKVGVQENEQI